MYRTKDFQLNSEYMKDWALQLDGNLGKYKLKKKKRRWLWRHNPYRRHIILHRKFLKRNKIQERFFLYDFTIWRKIFSVEAEIILSFP